VAVEGAPAAAELRSYYYDPAGALHTDLSLEAIRVALAEPHALLWLDVSSDGRAEGEAVLRDVFGFHPLTIDDCYNTLIDPPKVDDYGDYLFVIVHNVHYHAGKHLLETAELNLYIGANYVVSVHRTPIHAVEDVRRRAEAHALVLQRGAAFLAHALIDVVVDDFHPVVEQIDEEVAALEELVLDDPRRETLQAVLTLKRNAQRLKRSILPQRDVMNRFSRNEYPHIIQSHAIMYFRDIYDHTVRVEEMIDTVRDLGDSALSTYLSSVNNRINEVMKALAVVTVVFLPLTLIASIYGTNFHHTIPEYDITGGFAGMIASMLLTLVVLGGYFRWRKWF
jgi:magnesium transporter